MYSVSFVYPTRPVYYSDLYIRKLHNYFNLCVQVDNSVFIVNVIEKQVSNGGVKDF